MDIDVSISVGDGRYGDGSVSVKIPISVDKLDPKKPYNEDKLKSDKTVGFLVGEFEDALISAMIEYSEKINESKEG